MGELQFDEIREQKSLFGVNNDIDEDLSQIDDIRPARSLFDVEDQQGVNDMQTLGLSDDAPEAEEWEDGFWERQFQLVPTRKQRQYDWTFGVIMPVVCFFFDPFIFKFWGSPGGGLLGAYKPFAYSGSFISILGMMAWLLWREKLGGYSAILSGLFFVAGFFALLIGIPLFPFSLVGSLALIGLVGFTPLFTSVIFLRNGVRALRAAKLDFNRSKLAGAIAVGSLWGLAVPYSLNIEVQRSLDLVAKGTPETIRVQGLKLRLLAPMVDAEQLNKPYVRAPENSVERSEISRLYTQLTGKELNYYPHSEW